MNYLHARRDSTPKIAYTYALTVPALIALDGTSTKQRLGGNAT
jgi:hypothetical protein